MQKPLLNLTTAFLLCCAAVQAAPSKKAVVAYVFPQDAALQPGDIDAPRLTRINYAFANIADGRMVTGFKNDAQNYAYLAALKKINPELTVLVSVGGWEWSNNFSDVSLTSTSRKIFIASVMQFITLYNLDGLDIDWEYPGMEGSSRNFRAEDKENFTLLIKELRKQFNKQEPELHRKLYLTIAAGASDGFIAHTQMSKVQRYLDTVNLMTYDYYEPGSEGLTGNHSPLFADPADPRKASSADSVKAFEKAGVPAAKILLGVPFYGHTWGQVPDQNHGLFQSGKQVAKNDIPPDTVSRALLNQGTDQGFTRYWDEAASVPYLYSAQKQIFISYEDAESLAAKCKYVRDQGLGGVMFWDYSSDHTGTLLKAIDSSLWTSDGQEIKTK